MYIRIWQHAEHILEDAKLERLKSTYTENSNTASKGKGILLELVHIDHKNMEEELGNNLKMLHDVRLGLPKTVA
jgi:hypothetical protein